MTQTLVRAEPAPVLHSGVLKRFLQSRPGGFATALARAGMAPKATSAQARNYAAGRVDRFTEGWTTTSLSSTASLLGQLDTLRARSRQLHRDNDYAKKFQQLVAVNVAGPHGFRFESRVYNPDGTPDTAANNAIEAAW
jgi:capsid protein